MLVIADSVRRLSSLFKPQHSRVHGLEPVLQHLPSPCLGTVRGLRLNRIVMNLNVDPQRIKRSKAYKARQRTLRWTQLTGRDKQAMRRKLRHLEFLEQLRNDEEY